MAHIRPATPADVPAIVGLIRELAIYEKLEHACQASAEALKQHLFPPPGQPPFCEALVAVANEATVGFALYFHNYSTFLTKPGIYLEDLYVQPPFRGQGIGKALLTHIAQLAVDRGCGRVEWSVLDWNAPSITFYKALGAVPMDEWTVYRLTGDALHTLAEKKP